MYTVCSSGNSCAASPISKSDQQACFTQINNYLKNLVPLIMGTSVWKAGRTALFITWDEPGPDAATFAQECPKPNLNPPSGSDPCQIPGIWIGPMIKSNYVSHHVYTLYSFLKTIETYWGLSSITSKDASATAMNEFFA
jgi:hypothetical protein